MMIVCLAVIYVSTNWQQVSAVASFNGTCANFDCFRFEDDIQVNADGVNFK
jgi:hypothetical protein